MLSTTPSSSFSSPPKTSNLAISFSGVYPLRLQPIRRTPRGKSEKLKLQTRPLLSMSESQCLSLPTISVRYQATIPIKLAICGRYFSCPSLLSNQLAFIPSLHPSFFGFVWYFGTD
ncbi:hypothetical protein TWF481_004758 [Arthrobotrys musiformis]|uniref:Uncharacterized protein n=1 Tax=Arthrobotrys musiformis TaxID=47236 RepID=A0AAV9WKG9_9PEZI